MKKKLLSILVVLAMVVAMLPALTMTALAEAQPIGESSTTWELSNDNTVLTIGGTGAMPDYNYENQRPWYSNISSITTVVIESGVTTIGGQAFSGCSSLTSVTIPTSITSIGHHAFSNCSALTKLTIPENVKNIWSYAFSGCVNLVSLTVKATTPPTLDSSPFGDATPTNLKVYVPLESIEAYKNDTSGVFPWEYLANRIKPTATKPNGAEWIVENETWYQLTENNTVLTIGGIGDMPDYSSKENRPWHDHKDTITTVMIEPGVTSLGKYAFYGCSILPSVTIPSSVTTISDSAFAYCRQLASVTIPTSVITIGEYAFNCCESLPSVTIPSSVSNIGTGAFNYGEALTSVKVEATTPPTLGKGAFYDCHSELKIYVPAASVTTYTEKDGWKTYVEQIQGAYLVDVAESKNGMVTVTPDFAPKDATVTVTVTPDEGYQLKSLKYNDGEDHDITSTKSFTMPAANVTVTAEFEETPAHTVEVSNLGYYRNPEPDVPLVEIGFKVKSNVGNTNLVYEVAAYSKTTGEAYFTVGDISADNGATFTDVVKKAYNNAGSAQDVHLVWRFKNNNPDLEWSDDIVIEVMGRVEGDPLPITLGEVKSHDPWDEKIDVGYTLAGLEADANYKVAFDVTAGGQTMSFTSNAEKLTDGTKTTVINTTELFGKKVFDPKAKVAVRLIKMDTEEPSGETKIGWSGPKEFMLGVHIHTFTYAANDGVITATCSAPDCPLTDSKATLTLTRPASLAYDGNVKRCFFADGEEDAWTGAGLKLPGITYYEKISGQDNYTLKFGSPVDAGDYMAKITVDGKDAQVKYTIDKATPYIKTNPAPTDINYGKKLADSTLAGGYAQISSTDSTQVGGLFEWKNPDTIPAVADSEVTLYDVTFTPADKDNYNVTSCQVTITVNHTHNLVLVKGQAPTEETAGWKDYYECKDSEGARGCGALFEDATGNTPIEDLAKWKAAEGRGYIAPLVHSITPVNGKDATATEPGFKAYYECKNCRKYYEDAEGKTEIKDISTWKAKGGNGYIPSGNEIDAAKDAAKAALDAENKKDPLKDETALTDGKKNIDNATTLADIESAKADAVKAVQEAQKTELATAKTDAKAVLDTEDAKDPLKDKTALTNGKDSIDKASTKAGVESAKTDAVKVVQEAQKTELVSAKTDAKAALDTENAKDPLKDKTALTNGKDSIDKATTKAGVESAKDVAIKAVQEAQKSELASAKTEAKAALDTENKKDPLKDETALKGGKESIDKASTKAGVESAKTDAVKVVQEAQKTELATAKTDAKAALDTENKKDPLKDKTALTNGKDSIDKATTKADVEKAKVAATKAIQEAQASQHKEYKITKGNDAKIDLAKLEDTLFTSEADFSKFYEVLVDEKVIDPKNYEAKSGSTEVTLKKEYIKTLSVGEHTLTIESTDGSASTKFSIVSSKDSPDTGDRNNVILWGVLAMAMAATLTACIVGMRKRKGNN